MRRLPAIGALSFLAACQPSPARDKAEVDPPATPSAAVCVGAGRSDCVVYRSGPVKDAAVDWDRGFFYQLQGTGAPGSGDNEYCKGGYCAVAILKRDESGRLIPVAHVESTDAQWYETPEIVPSPAGPLIVARSNSLGMGAFNDDVVLRTDEAGKLRRIDVNSWKNEAHRLAPDANSHFDWNTDYSAFVGQTGLASRDPNDSARASVGSVRVFLVLKGDALQIGSPMARFP